MEAATVDEKYMSRCLDLAKVGLGRTAPNPMVGCVIVQGDSIIGEGYHRAFGEHHAEVEAIESVTDKALLKESTLYTNLEPCSHEGKTPPCTMLIKSCGIPKVVIGTLDTNAEVSGRGALHLRQAGCEVISGVLEDECRELNKRFFTFHEMGRPFVILKWAQTANGFIDRKRTGGKPLLITGMEARRLLHKWRSEEQAVMVGTNTALLDNPRLTVRHWKGHNPLRIIPDRTLRLPDTLGVFKRDTPTLILTEREFEDKENLTHCHIVFGDAFLPAVMKLLRERDIQSLIVEGGAALLNAFIDAGIWDEARVFISDLQIAVGVQAPVFSLGGEPAIVGQDRLYTCRNA